MRKSDQTRPEHSPDDDALDQTLRPPKLEQFAGQEKIVQNLKIFIQAAKQRGEPLEHVLFTGPPGLGKTTLALIIANEMGAPINWKSGFGNYIEIRHPSNMITSYGHLRGFARGLSVGDHVTQGQMIGFVGSTGQSTGPHLDYRVMKNGRFIDPLKMVVPAALPVKEQYRAEFEKVVVEYMPKLEKAVPDSVNRPALAGRN